MNPLLVLGALLAMSVAGNGLLGKQWLDAREDATQARALGQQQADAAKRCSDGVESLRSAAEARAVTAEAERNAALQLAQAAQGRAQALLNRRPTVAGDNCASARVQIDDWLSTRVRP